MTAMQRAAVTMCFAVRGNFPWIRVPGYVLMQLFGATAAALFLRAVFGNVGELAGGLLAVSVAWLLRGPPTTAGDQAAQGDLGFETDSAAAQAPESTGSPDVSHQVPGLH